MLEHTALAAGVGAAGAIVLLLVGTQIMDWYWPALLFLAGLAAGLVRARQQRLTRYQVAQVVDHSLGLQDRLATLVWYRERGEAVRTSLDTMEHQALSRVQPDDAVRAVPVKVPKYGYVCVALMAAAAGMMGIRYGVLHTMDLSKPLAQVDFEFFTPEPKVQAAAKKTAIQERLEQQLKELGLNVDDLQNEKGLEPIEANVPATPDQQGAQAPQPGQKNGKSPESSPDGTEGSEAGEKSQGDETAQGEQSESGQPQQQGKPQQNSPQNAKSGSQGSQNSLMNKMRDALSNLMNKMKMNQDSGQQTAMNQQSQQQGQQGQQQGQGQQSRSQAKDGSQSQQGQEGDQDGQGEKSAGEKSQAGDKSSDRPGSQDSKSGMGQSEGDKSIKEAEQLAAMGKISEIFGKRAQQVSGEITVEVSSGKQQLKTAWSERKALHADTGAEVNRDEIPLAYQRYIQRYFEEVRKTAPAKAPKAGS